MFHGHYSTVHETDLCTFWTNQAFVSGKLCFLYILHEFGHRSITQQPLFVSCTVYRGSKRKETVLFGKTTVLVGRVLYTGTKSTLKVSDFGVFLVFLRPSLYGERQATVSCRRNRCAHVSWTLEYTKLSCAYSGQVKLLCQENSVSCAQNGTLRTLSSSSCFQVLHTQSIKYHRSCAILRVFCFPNVSSCGSRDTTVPILNAALVVHLNFVISQ